MPTYAIIRMERHLVTASGDEFSQIVIKPKPLTIIEGKPLSVEGETPENALAFAVRRYPHFRHLLAVQEISEYESQHPTNDTSRVLRGAKARSPRAQG